MRGEQSPFNEYEGMLPIDIPYVMIVESDSSIAETLQEVIKKELQLDLLFATTAKDALHIIQVLRPSVFVINEHLLDADGVRLAKQLSQIAGLQHIPVILLSTNKESCQQRTRHSSLYLMELPFELDDLISTINRLLACFQPSNTAQKSG